MSATLLYHPGHPFISPELQTLLREGALHHLIDDVYLPAGYQVNPQVRAEAAARILTARIRKEAVLCGETAAWVHTGGPAPERVALIISTARRHRPADGLDWQLHQVPVSSEELICLGEPGTPPVTRPQRTAEDLFLGIGTVGSRGAMDTALRRMAGDRRRLDWPSRAPGDLGPDERMESFHRADRRAMVRRWKTLSQLLRTAGEQIDQEELIRNIMERLSRGSCDLPRRQNLTELLGQCTSRRFPTVL